MLMSRYFTQFLLHIAVKQTDRGLEGGKTGTPEMEKLLQKFGVIFQASIYRNNFRKNIRKFISSLQISSKVP